MLLWSTVNLLSAVLAVSAMLFYVFVYTIWLKPRSPQNIVIGGAGGAVPVLVGWAAVTGSLAAPAWILFAIVFLWTPPHFWALSLRYFDDYQGRRDPDAAGGQGRAHGSAPDRRLRRRRGGDGPSPSPLVTDNIGAVYLVTAAVLGTLFIAQAVRLASATPRRRRPYGWFTMSRTPTSRSSSPPLPSTPSSAPSEPAPPRRARWLLAALRRLALVVVVGAITWIAVASNNDSSDDAVVPAAVRNGGPKVGDPAPDFTLRTARREDRTTVRLPGHAGRTELLGVVLPSVPP